MDFTTIVVIVLVLAIAYILAKAFAKKADTNNDGVVSKEEAVAEVKAEVKAVRATATKAKATVKKATTRKPRTTAK
jgi:uncharacterized protein (UPF0333 family)